MLCLIGDSHLRLIAADMGGTERHRNWRTRSFQPFKADKDTNVHRDYCTLVFELGLVLLFINFATDVVRDRQTGCREFRKLNGEDPTIYWLEIVLRAMGPLLVSIFATSFVLTSVEDRYRSAYLHYTNPTVLLSVLYLYALHMTTFMLLFTVFFTSVTYVAVASCIWLIVSLLPHVFFVEMSLLQLLASCMLPNTGLQLAMDLILTFERDRKNLLIFFALRFWGLQRKDIFSEFFI